MDKFQSAATFKAGSSTATIDGTAIAGSDYIATQGTVTFKPGETTQIINTTILDDAIFEDPETFKVKLTNPTNTTIKTAEGNATIIDGGTKYKLDPSNSGTVSILDNDPQIPKLTQPLPNILSIEGGIDKSFLKFTKIAQEGLGKNETFAFVVDDDKGRIGGIAPGAEGYLNAALDRSKVIFSNLGNNSVDRKFDLGSQRTLKFAPGDRVEFGSIVDDTIDKVKLDLQSGKPTSKVLFSLPSANADNGNQAQFTPLPNDGGYEIAWSNTIDSKATPVYNDLVFKVESLNNFTAPVGTNLQGDGEGEVLDLRNFAGKTLKIDTVAVSDAGYNNYIGFYAVADVQGTLANGLKVTDVGYAEAAIKSAVLRSFKSETQSDRQVAGGEILAPVVIANGTFEDFLENNPQNQANSNIHAYFNYLGANTDKVDRFRLLGDIR
jgi:Calx-beta domain